MPERADAVIVGARCAGSAAAIALARAGRSVVALDRARFPSDTLSTHQLWPGGVAELKRLGALERVEALGAPRLPEALAGWGGLEIRGTYTPVDGIDYGLCVRRPGLDAALVETAREAGAEVLERCTASALVRRGGRVAGVRYRDPEGGEREILAPLVVGADGRRSLVAREVGVEDAVLESANGRGCYFAYWHDARPEWCRVAAQWRRGEDLATAFPCDGGLVLVLLMPPVARAHQFKGNIEGEYERTVAAIPELRARLDGCERRSKVRHTNSTASYFRRSSGPGWALPGDAGHFKDPITAQGIRDALRFGRLLGEAAGPVLDDPRALDRALKGWERRRNRECLETYQWTNRVARAEAMNPIEAELYRQAASDTEVGRALADVFSRSVRPGELLTARLLARLAGRALTRPGADRREVLRVVRRELADGLRDRVQRLDAFSA
ncbi:MAG: FAD-dependent monooxygenase [Actinomycetota bacterium]|nr:FAD-dependent monooxygenase [Actinomycetota bacterium]